MSLPVTISGVQFPDRNYYCGPFKPSNGCIYLVLQDSSSPVPEVWKCSDFDFPSGAFTEQDSTNKPSSCSAGTQWAHLSGNIIHIVYSYDDGTNNWYYYAKFDTSNDTWITTDDQIDTWDDKYEPLPFACSISERVEEGGQDPTIVLYAGAKDKIGGSNYSRVDCAHGSAGSWTAALAVDGGGSVNFYCNVAIRGSSPDANGHVVHFFYKNQSKYILARSLYYSSGWQLSTEVQGPLSDVSTARSGPGIRYLDNGIDRIILPYDDDVAGEPAVARFSEDVNDDVSYDGQTDISTVLVDSFNFTSIVCGAVDSGSGKMYVMWGEYSADGDDLRYDSDDPPYTTNNWGTDSEISMTDIRRVSCNIYPRNGDLKLAYVYDDNGTIKYDEVSIADPAAPSFANATFPQQSFYVGPEKV